ncbi:hypothetical protein SAMN05443287_104268 [Micromonospora phaseoli]|uniref:Uncharacterized protein n=1 Tax=Micromonospora phaseoli TaxID=1144548 RepID=A0A1H6YRL0_9ACTN|nr:hypothetical protein [Micromonospora phaseoli]PZW00240.1 hypothetical protein CLV64_103267 [Micromonospora phaseoli]GIJ81005.1 hypothetical protein Xph01_54370 [Micromonospora phaseoli]SEJ41587.1 hypothetical protein SAMN05443287_104268 [Micromonospora phaseoli]
MTEPDEARDDEFTEAILAPPTANPARVQVPAEGLGGQTDEGHPEPSGSPPAEEG